MNLIRSVTLALATSAIAAPFMLGMSTPLLGCEATAKKRDHPDSARIHESTSSQSSTNPTLVEVDSQTALGIAEFLQDNGAVVDHCRFPNPSGDVVPTYYNDSWVCFQAQANAYVCQQLVYADGTITIPDVICQDPSIGGRS